MEDINKNFYKNYIEAERDLENFLVIVFENSDLIINYTDDILFDKGELNLRKYILSKNKSILSRLKERIKNILLKEVRDQKWKVYSEMDTEIEACASKSQSLLEAYDIRNEKKANIRFGSILGKELKKELSYGLIIKEYLSILENIYEEISKEVISEVAKNIAMRWYPIYSKNIELLNENFESKGIRKDIKEEEINIKPRIEKNNSASREDDWSFQKKIENIFNQKMGKRKGSSSMEVNESMQGDKYLDMLSDLVFRGNEIKELYKDKRIVSPENFVKNIETIEEESLYGFKNMRSAFSEEIVPKKNLSVLKMIADLFETILEDEALNTESKLMICKLQFPIIKTSLLNEKQITSNDSVLNNVMKKLTNEIKLTSNFESYHFKKIKEKIESISKMNFDVMSYNDILQKWSDLDNIIKNNEKRVSLIEARSKEKELGIYYFDKAEKELKKDINSLLLDAEFVPSQFCNFIEQDIKNNLMITKLKDLKNETDYYSKQKIVLETWFSALFVFEDKEKAKKYSEMIYKVLSNNNPPDKTKLSNKVKEVYQYIFKKKTPIDNEFVQDFQKNKYAEYSELYKDFDKDKRFNSSDLGEEASVFEALEYGDWLEIKKEDLIKYCKLLLKMNNNRKFIFVDSNGVQNLEAEINELVSLYKKNELKILEKSTVMERALDKVLSKK